MKTFSKTIVVVLFIMVGLIFQTNQTSAQNQQHPLPPKKLPDSTQIAKMVFELSKELSLSETQKTKISELFFDHFKEAKVMMEKNKAKHEQNKKTMDAFKKEFETQVNNQLTDDQKVEFKDFMKNRRPPKKGNQKPQH